MAGARNIFFPTHSGVGGKVYLLPSPSKLCKKNPALGIIHLRKKNSWWSGVSVSSYFPPNQREHTLNNTSSSIPTQEAKERKRTYYTVRYTRTYAGIWNLAAVKKNSGKYLTSSRNGDQSRNYVTPTAVKTYRKPCGGGRGGLSVRKKVKRKRRKGGWLFVGQIAASAPPSLLPVITGSLPIDKSEIEIPFGRKK